nr:polyprenol phosphomannose-dependent alpha 1,6 mannosyltransferase MptB [Nocardioides marinus]
MSRGLLGSALVLLGGLVVSTLPRSAPILQVEALAALRGAEAGRMLGLAVVLTGLGLLAAAWLRLCREVGAGRETGDRDEAVGLVRFATLVWSAPLVLAPPLFSRDGWSYAAQGAMTHLGISPYEHGPSVLRGPVVQAVDPRWMDTITPYGPVPLAVGDQLAALTGNPWMLVIGHRVLALVGLALLAWAVPRLATWTGVDPALASALVIASPLMLANGVGGLHNDLLMAGLMAAALVVAVEHGWAWGAVLGGTAAAVKAPGGLVCVAVALVGLPAAATLTDRVRRLAGVAGVSLGWLVGLGLLTGVGVGWVAGLTVPGTVNTPLSVTTLAGGSLDWVAGLLGLDLAPATLLGVVRTLGSGAALGLVGWAALRRPTGDRASAVGTAALLMGGLVVLSPVVHLWYLLWVVPFVATLRLSRLAVTALVAVSVIAGLVAPMDSSLHGAYYAIVLGSMIVAILAPVLLWTRGARARVERIATAHLPGLADLVPAPPRATAASVPPPRQPLGTAELSGLLRSFR